MEGQDSCLTLLDGMIIRSIKNIFPGQPTIEGAGVHLRRIFGYHEMPEFDPFLLFDHFGSSNPDDYLKGFPWHPHRGIETITYVLNGKVEHGDSIGNKGVIGAGDVQWMTAGSGIIHQEMPKGDENAVNRGFQLWANLPRSQKMMAPRYREVKIHQIPEVITKENVKIKVICGEVYGTKGPVDDIITDPQYLDITIPPGTSYNHSTETGYTVFAYVIEGNGSFDERGRSIPAGNLVLFNDGETLTIKTTGKLLRLLLISGKPIKEPIAWYGPIVMNTEAELKKAFEEYRDGTFVKK
jgi:redox-sensitive bicupin YhaK (pirin superfamily)